MASLTKKTMNKRRSRKKNMGKDRKRTLRAKGSTPAFAIHQDGAKAAPASK